MDNNINQNELSALNTQQRFKRFLINKTIYLILSHINKSPN